MGFFSNLFNRGDSHENKPHLYVAPKNEPQISNPTAGQGKQNVPKNQEQNRSINDEGNNYVPKHHWPD